MHSFCAELAGWTERVITLSEDNDGTVAWLLMQEGLSTVRDESARCFEHLSGVERELREELTIQKICEARLNELSKTVVERS